MSRAPSTFKQRDVKAAIKAAIEAGCVIARIEVGKDGRIILILVGKEQSAGEVEANEWDNAT